MKRVLILAATIALAPAVSAPWTYEGYWGEYEDKNLLHAFKTRWRPPKVKPWTNTY